MATRDQQFARQVIERDKRCQECGSVFNLQAHHIIPFSEEGPDEPSNGITLCVSCHRKRHPRGTTIGFYFRDMEQDEINALRARLNALAAEFGYIAKRGPTAGRGNLAALLIAIGDGEFVLIQRDPETEDVKAIGLEGKLDGDDIVHALQEVATVKILR